MHKVFIGTGLHASCWRRVFLGTLLTVVSTVCSPAWGQTPQEPGEAERKLRIPRQQAQTTAAIDGVVRAGTEPNAKVAGALLRLRNLTTESAKEVIANGEGV